jgi:hypothetical protein
MTIGDLIGGHNKFLKFDDVKTLYGIEDKHFLEYITLCKCIPSNWRRTIYSSKDNLETDIDICIYIRNISIPLERCTNKCIYNAFVDIKSTKIPKSIVLWEKLLGLNQEQMSYYFTIPYKHSKDCKIQSMQYRIINNMYITKKNLCKWGKMPKPTCLECDEVDDYCLPSTFN